MFVGEGGVIGPQSPVIAPLHYPGGRHQSARLAAGWAGSSLAARLHSDCPSCGLLGRPGDSLGGFAPPSRCPTAELGGSPFRPADPCLPSLGTTRPRPLSMQTNMGRRLYLSAPEFLVGGEAQRECSMALRANHSAASAPRSPESQHRALCADLAYAVWARASKHCGAVCACTQRPRRGGEGVEILRGNLIQRGRGLHAATSLCARARDFCLVIQAARVASSASLAGRRRQHDDSDSDTGPCSIRADRVARGGASESPNRPPDLFPFWPFSRLPSKLTPASEGPSPSPAPVQP